MNPTDHPVQEFHEKPTQQPTTTTESAKDTVSSIGDSVSDLATTSWNGLKSTATNAASNEHVQNTWTQIRSATIGPAEGETPEPGVFCPVEYANNRHYDCGPRLKSPQ